MDRSSPRTIPPQRSARQTACILRLVRDPPARDRHETAKTHPSLCTISRVRDSHVATPSYTRPRKWSASTGSGTASAFRSSSVPTHCGTRDMPVTGQSVGTISARTLNVKSEINPFNQQRQPNAQFWMWELDVAPWAACRRAEWVPANPTDSARRAASGRWHARVSPGVSGGIRRAVALSPREGGHSVGGARAPPAF